ncbi:MAG: hypothetical protein AAGF02_18610 [Actinomycetota bacterium]
MQTIEAKPTTTEADPERPDAVMQIFGLLVAVALVIISATFVIDVIRDLELI